jgi:hypothetical protein
MIGVFFDARYSDTNKQSAKEYGTGLGARSLVQKNDTLAKCRQAGDAREKNQM